MTATTYSRLPYWRWWRVRRHRQNTRRGGIAKPWNGLVLIAALVLTDQLTKQINNPLSPPHVAPDNYLVAQLIVLLPFLYLLRHHATRLAAAFMLAGTLGNVTSVAAHGAAPNPFTFFPNGHGIAFNVADVCLTVGSILTLTAIPAVIAARPRRLT